MFFHNLEDLTISCRGREATLPCLHPLEKRKEKIEIGKEEEADREERMMKNKANARVAATGQRSISLFLLQG